MQFIIISGEPLQSGQSVAANTQWGSLARFSSLLDLLLEAELNLRMTAIRRD